MRRIIATINLLAIIAYGTSCQTEDIPQDVNTLGVGSYVKLVEKNGGIIDATNPAGSTATIKVSEYGTEQEKIVVYVSKGTRTTDRSRWRQIKEVPATAAREYDIAVTGAEIVAAMGAPVAPGEIYTLYNSVITKDGGRFDFGNINGEVVGNPNYNMAFTWQATVVCPFIAADAAGTYTIVADNWDGAVGETSVVTAVQGTAPTPSSATLTYAFPFAAPPGVNPLVLTIDTNTGSVTVARQTYGSYGTGFENFTAQGTGFFFSCTGFIDLSLVHVAGNGTNYGTYVLRMQK
jgi:hypothetical protein